jgi:hypothetical protein
MKKQYFAGLLVTAFLTFVLTPVPDFATQLLNVFIAVVVYNLILLVLKRIRPSLFASKRVIWVSLICSVLSIAIALLVYVVLPKV